MNVLDKLEHAMQDWRLRGPHLTPEQYRLARKVDAELLVVLERLLKEVGRG